ncbi:hypothetical protein K432DRAFT_431209 [Lepidopterella palustris CBS 459.81]|uniref:glutathione transferase n=1 Tax=Lepidopterella palustris CBS 459.81 TaxID=1314670 RepID=A0A8E2ELC1_9PEZI|nr:hypothetical protein K432DRAFT_431209 [Lepidopterella palustris CBS 459.81]
MLTNGEPDYSKFEHPKLPDGITLYVKKANPTNTANTIKPLILLEALKIPHHIHIIQSTSSETWFHDVNPYKMVPAISDIGLSSPSSETKIFDSSACLAYLAEKYDADGVFSGKGLEERAAVMAWLMSYTAGLGATGKTWLMLRNKPDAAGALPILVNWIRQEYAALEKRLGEPGQEFVALRERPTIADFAILPLANEKVAATAEIELKREFPRLWEWSERVGALEYVKRAGVRVVGFGHVEGI